MCQQPGRRVPRGAIGIIPARNQYLAIVQQGRCMTIRRCLLVLPVKVLVAGCTSTTADSTIRRQDPTFTGSTKRQRPYGHTATLLNNGKVLIAGGDDTDCTSAELYDPAAGTWSLTGSLNDGRYFHTATLLPDGTVLAAGGLFGTYLASSELYDQLPDLDIHRQTQSGTK